jgi:putative transposase
LPEGAGTFRPRNQKAEGGGAFRPPDPSKKRNRGFSRGPFHYPFSMRLAPQETRTYFVTAVTVRRRRIFQVSTNAELLQKTILDYRAQNRFLLHAFVIMPDHFHAILTPAPDVSLEKAMQFIKGGFSFRLKSKLDVWERGFNESQILSAEKFRSVARYIEENPVRRGLAPTPEEFPYSSAAWAIADPMPAHMR